MNAETKAIVTSQSCKSRFKIRDNELYIAYTLPNNTRNESSYEDLTYGIQSCYFHILDAYAMLLSDPAYHTFHLTPVNAANNYM